MTNIDFTHTNKENSHSRSWWERNGPTVYGIAVFVILAVIGALHSLTV